MPIKNRNIATNAAIEASKLKSSDIGHTQLSTAVEKYADVSLTTAQIDALAATPIQLVAAPGTNKAIIFLGASIKYTYSGAAWTVDAGDNLEIRYTDGSGALCATIETASTGLALDGAASTAIWVPPAGNTPATANSGIAYVANAKLVIDAATDLVKVSGSTAGTIKVRVFYKVIDTNF